MDRRERGKKSKQKRVERERGRIRDQKKGRIEREKREKGLK